MGWQELDKAFSNVEPAKEAGGWVLVPDGTVCKLVIVDHKPHTTTKRGANSHSVETIFEVVEPAEYAGSRIWRYFGLSESNLGYLKRDLQLLGWQGTKISSLMSTDDSTLIGLGCEAVIGVEESQFPDKTTGELKKRTKNVLKVIKVGWTMPKNAAPASDGFDPNKIPF